MYRSQVNIYIITDIQYIEQNTAYRETRYYTGALLKRGWKRMHHMSVATLPFPPTWPLVSTPWLGLLLVLGWINNLIGFIVVY